MTDTSIHTPPYRANNARRTQSEANCGEQSSAKRFGSSASERYSCTVAASKIRTVHPGQCCRQVSTQSLKSSGMWSTPCAQYPQMVISETSPDKPLGGVEGTLCVRLKRSMRTSNRCSGDPSMALLSVAAGSAAPGPAARLVEIGGTGGEDLIDAAACSTSAAPCDTACEVDDEGCGGEGNDDDDGGCGACCAARGRPITPWRQSSDPKCSRFTGGDAVLPGRGPARPRTP
mmetsp:Transcript_8944/g.24409  ORF Transcript_8944/g.24409 Transcript_8944/m.24409 type:complete len:231 (-) Transcript_8944:13-705(-)